jgi:hypothetical protein
MSPIPSVFECQSCGYSSSKWLGRCPDCGNWNSFVEGKKITPPKRDTALGGDRNVPVALSEISTESTPRVSTANEEFDRVLGGGIVPGSLVLLGGEPGVANRHCCCKSRRVFSPPWRKPAKFHPSLKVLVYDRPIGCRRTVGPSARVDIMSALSETGPTPQPGARGKRLLFGLSARWPGRDLVLEGTIESAARG